jgi:hypothetical protein
VARQHNEILSETLKGAMISAAAVAVISAICFGFIWDVPVFAWQRGPFPTPHSVFEIVVISSAAGFMVGGIVAFVGASKRS